jgi:hypothetical protein
MERIAWTDYCTIVDRKTGVIKRRTACEVWIPQNPTVQCPYILKFIDVTPK